MDEAQRTILVRIAGRLRIQARAVDELEACDALIEWLRKPVTLPAANKVTDAVTVTDKVTVTPGKVTPVTVTVTTNKVTGKRGRPKLAEAPLTAAEKMRRYRARQREAKS